MRLSNYNTQTRALSCIMPHIFRFVHVWVCDTGLVAMTYRREPIREVSPREGSLGKPATQYFEERRAQLHLTLKKSSSAGGDISRYRYYARWVGRGRELVATVQIFVRSRAPPSNVTSVRSRDIWALENTYCHPYCITVLAFWLPF